MFRSEGLTCHWAFTRHHQGKQAAGDRTGVRYGRGRAAGWVEKIVKRCDVQIVKHSIVVVVAPGRVGAAQASQPHRGGHVLQGLAGNRSIDCEQNRQADEG